MENEKINIVIVDDHLIVIEGLKMMLKSQPFSIFLKVLFPVRKSSAYSAAIR
jgi:DNA-binding NarL/FixJ family response regulator